MFTSRPANNPSKVDLPEPEDPTIATDSPSLISIFIPFNRVKFPVFDDTECVRLDTLMALLLFIYKTLKVKYDL